MDNTDFLNKSEPSAQESQKEEKLQTASGLVVPENSTYVDKGSDAAVDEEELKETDEALNQDKTDTAPGPVHSALGLHDASNAGVAHEGEVDVVVNDATNPKNDVKSDAPAGWPVLSEKPKK